MKKPICGWLRIKLRKPRIIIVGAADRFVPEAVTDPFIMTCRDKPFKSENV